MNQRKVLKRIRELCPWGITPLHRTCGFVKCNKECAQIEKELLKNGERTETA